MEEEKEGRCKRKERGRLRNWKGKWRGGMVDAGKGREENKRQGMGRWKEK